MHLGAAFITHLAQNLFGERRIRFQCFAQILPVGDVISAQDCFAPNVNLCRTEQPFGVRRLLNLLRHRYELFVIDQILPVSFGWRDRRRIGELDADVENLLLLIWSEFVHQLHAETIGFGLKRELIVVPSLDQIRQCRITKIDTPEWHD